MKQDIQITDLIKKEYERDPRSFSQLTTSFLASGSQGILRSLFFSFSYF